MLRRVFYVEKRPVMNNSCLFAQVPKKARYGALKQDSIQWNKLHSAACKMHDSMEHYYAQQP